MPLVTPAVLRQVPVAASVAGRVVVSAGPLAAYRVYTWVPALIISLCCRRVMPPGGARPMVRAPRQGAPQ